MLTRFTSFDIFAGKGHLRQQTLRSAFAPEAESLVGNFGGSFKLARYGRRVIQRCTRLKKKKERRRAARPRYDGSRFRVLLRTILRTCNSERALGSSPNGRGPEIVAAKNSSESNAESNAQQSRERAAQPFICKPHADAHRTRC